ncbi:hypothetical protein, partial [Archangium sp.]|uniref:hypothetical protein n=1 Tax=Archangium sp. TaxID=1872627 RepID=UPI002D3BE104
MSKNALKSYIHLPPGAPSGDVVRDFLALIFKKFKWFTPARYGDADLAESITPDKLDALHVYYEEHDNLCVAARTDRDFIWILPCKSGADPYHGQISWVTSAASASKASWRAAHVDQVGELMRLFQSPLATSALASDVESKCWRWVQDGIGETLTPNVRGYGEGLAGLFWRNFFGPPYVRMFGQRLDALPTECRKPLGEDIVLVQPYELPTEAGTEAGMARERELISLLGSEC